MISRPIEGYEQRLMTRQELQEVAVAFEAWKAQTKRCDAGNHPPLVRHGTLGRMCPHCSKLWPMFTA